MVMLWGTRNTKHKKHAKLIWGKLWFELIKYLQIYETTKPVNNSESNAVKAFYETTNPVKVILNH